MSNVIHLRPNLDIATGLRNMADDIEKGVYEGNHLTAILSEGDIFHLGEIDDDRAAEQAIFNMTFGIHKMMYYPCRILDE